jgi:hypothetical protein
VALTHLGCPTCGAALAAAEGQRLVTCRYCRGTALVDVPGALARYTVSLGVSQEGARAAAQQFLEQSGAIRVTRPRLQLTLCYLPFYEFTAFRLGTFLLKEAVKPPAPLGEESSPEALDGWLQTPPVVREDTRVVEASVLRVGPACRLPALGVERIPLESLRQSKTPVALEPFDLGTLQRRAVVFTPTEPPHRFREDAEWRIPVRSDRTGFVAQRLKLLYYPVWQAQFVHAGNPFQIAVDGVTGRILAAQAPVDLSPGIVPAVGLLAAAAFCLGRGVMEILRAMARTSAHAGLPLPPALMLLGLVLAGVGWMALASFRSRGELVLTGTDEAPRVDIGSSGGILDGIRQGLAEALVRFQVGQVGQVGMTGGNGQWPSR